MVFYNDNDRFCCQWLRNLIEAGHLPYGRVVERSIVEIPPGQLGIYETSHFFAGIGGWPLALRLAGWPTANPVWTGSCPCQPLSCAGKRKGATDERHLWPAWQRIIAVCRPRTIFGEQVASKAGREWFAGVRADLEDLGYAVGCADLCAASVGAPHIRQRLFWVADARHQQAWRPAEPRKEESGRTFSDLAGCGESGGLAYTASDRTWRATKAEPCSDQSEDGVSRQDSSVGGLGDTPVSRDGSHLRQSRSIAGTQEQTGGSSLSGRLGDAASEQVGRTGQPRQNFWWPSDLIPCADGTQRRIEPGTFPLVDGLSPGMGSVRPGEVSPFRVIRDPKTGKSIGQAPWRIGMLKGYGNAIVPPLAAQFIRAYMSITMTPELENGDAPSIVPSRDSV